MGELIAFPDPWRRQHAANLARTVARYSPPGAQNYIRAQVRNYRRFLRSEGAHPASTEVYCEALQADVWAALGRVASSHGGAA